MPLPKKVSIVEVGPRDGLQNEKQTIDSRTKATLVDLLVRAGVSVVEAGSFVNPKWVPQMADSAQVFASLDRQPSVRYSALTPNLQGFERAMAAGATEVAVFAAASEAFSQKNINCSIEESLLRFEPVMQAAAQSEIPVRAYLSCVLGCPYQGEVESINVLHVSEKLLELGCYEVSLGDTIGVGTPGSVNSLLEALSQAIEIDRLAVHFHDTYGMAIANIYAALQHGVSVIDSSVAGLGGCPYAKGATGNVATEDVIYLLDGLGIEHGIDINKLMAAGEHINSALGRSTSSRVAAATSKAAQH